VLTRVTAKNVGDSFYESLADPVIIECLLYVPCYIPCNCVVIDVFVDYKTAHITNSNKKLC